MKEYLITFYGDVCGIVAADVRFYARSLQGLKNKIREYAAQLPPIDLVQVYNCTDDKLHEAHLSSLNFHSI